MHTLAFFDAAPAIVVADPLAETLGAAEGGLIEYRYVDAFKDAGHSCPTVAGAWLMTRAALARLYPGETPQRGEIRFTRLDNGRSVELSHRPQAVPRPAGMSELLRDALAPQASTTARRAFAQAWQGWVQVILTEHADDPALIETTA